MERAAVVLAARPTSPLLIMDMVIMDVARALRSTQFRSTILRPSPSFATRTRKTKKQSVCTIISATVQLNKGSPRPLKYIFGVC